MTIGEIKKQVILIDFHSNDNKRKSGTELDKRDRYHCCGARYGKASYPYTPERDLAFVSLVDYNVAELFSLSRAIF
jgi:hypothetical protein